MFLRRNLAAVAARFAPENPRPRVAEVVQPDAETRHRREENNHLARAAADIASQGGEDGVTQKILETLGFTAPGWCVEFGACDGRTDSNTWNLVKNKGWKAVYIEPEPGFYTRLEQHVRETPGTWCFNEFVGWEGESSLDNILARTPIPAEPEFMVIDIDGADYYVWEGLKNYRPHVICVEFHKLISPHVHFVPEKETAWNRPSSIRALTELGKRKGYELVCVINWNLFFVRREHFAKFGIADNRPESMFEAQEEMRLLQGYDGTLFHFNNTVHYWKYQHNEAGVVTNVPITHNDIQVLPDGLRRFRPRHTYRSRTLEAQAGRLDAARFPANALLAHRRNVYSECGEDGILAHIFARIGVSHRYCVEIGAGDGKTRSNTANLIENGEPDGEPWRGLMIEPDGEAFAALSERYRGNARVECVQARIDSRQETLEGQLRRHGAPTNFDLLSIDVDGNDYHILASLAAYSPAVVVIDFNPSAGNDVRFVQEEDAEAHYGASLFAVVELAERMHYTLAAVTDWNAIFVRNDLFPRLGMQRASIAEMYAPPFEMRMFQTLDGCLHLSGCDVLARQDHRIEWEDFQVIPRSLRGRDNSAERFGTLAPVFYG